MAQQWQLNIPLNAAFADLILEQIAGGKSLREVCSVSWMPSEDTVRNWIAKNPDFKAAYEAAILVRVDNYVDECIKIADEAIADPAFISKANLQIKTRQWLATKLNPKYSDKLDMNVGNQNDKAFRVEMVPGDEKV
jgi:hypothetical protein